MLYRRPSWPSVVNHDRKDDAPRGTEHLRGLAGLALELGLLDRHSEARHVAANVALTREAVLRSVSRPHPELGPVAHAPPVHVDDLAIEGLRRKNRAVDEPPPFAATEQSWRRREAELLRLLARLLHLGDVLAISS